MKRKRTPAVIDNNQLDTTNALSIADGRLFLSHMRYLNDKFITIDINPKLEPHFVVDLCTIKPEQIQSLLGFREKHFDFIFIEGLVTVSNIKQMLMNVHYLLSENGVVIYANGDHYMNGNGESDLCKIMKEFFPNVIDYTGRSNDDEIFGKEYSDHLTHEKLDQILPQTKELCDLEFIDEDEEYDFLLEDENDENENEDTEEESSNARLNVALCSDKGQPTLFGASKNTQQITNGSHPTLSSNRQLSRIEEVTVAAK